MYCNDNVEFKITFFTSHSDEIVDMNLDSRLHVQVIRLHGAAMHLSAHVVPVEYVIVNEASDHLLERLLPQPFPTVLHVCCSSSSYMQSDIGCMVSSTIALTTGTPLNEGIYIAYFFLYHAGLHKLDMHCYYAHERTSNDQS